MKCQKEADVKNPPYAPQSFWPRQENWNKSPVQNRFFPVGAQHWIKHKITSFLWNFRVCKKIPCQTLAPSITASLLSWTIVSALSFPPTLLAIILLFPPFPTLGFLPSHLQEHPLPPQTHRTITDSVNPSLSGSASCSLGHTQAETQTAVLTSFQIMFFRHTGLQVLRMGELCPALLG